MTISSKDLPPGALRAMHRAPALYQPGTPVRPAPKQPVASPQMPVESSEAPNKPKQRRRGNMNRTERAHSIILEARRQAGEIVSWRFEGIRLKWGHDLKTGSSMHYCPDFVVFLKDSERPLLIEVKGKHIRDRDIVRFKGCRASWPEFDFQMLQWKNGCWTRLH